MSRDRVPLKLTPPLFETPEEAENSVLFVADYAVRLAPMLISCHQRTLSISWDNIMSVYNFRYGMKTK